MLLREISISAHFLRNYATFFLFFTTAEIEAARSGGFHSNTLYYILPTKVNRVR